MVQDQYTQLPKYLPALELSWLWYCCIMVTSYFDLSLHNVRAISFLLYISVWANPVIAATANNIAGLIPISMVMNMK